MTEKRFTYMEQFNGFCDVYDNGKILSCMRLEYVENTVNLLNEFNDKCEFLEIENESLEDGATKYAELYHKSLKENEQLKKQLDETIEGLHKEITTSENAFEGLMNENKELRDACKNYDWYKLYKQLLNENEQLKSDNKDYIKRYSELFDEYKKNKNENKQLKEEIETLHEQLAHFDG